MQTTLCSRATDVNNGSDNNRPYSRRGNNHQVIPTISCRRVNNGFHLHDIVIVNPSSDHRLTNDIHVSYYIHSTMPNIQLNLATARARALLAFVNYVVVTSLQTILNERDILLLRRSYVLNNINTVTSQCCELQIIKIIAS